MSFAAKIIKGTALVSHVTWTDKDGDACYAVVNIEKSKRNAFNDALQQDAGMNLEDYGTVLYKGFGDIPEEVKDDLREKYGMFED